MPRCLGCSNADDFEVLSEHGKGLKTLRCQVCGLQYAFCEIPADPDSWRLWLALREGESAETFAAAPTPATLLDLCREGVYLVTDEENGALTGEIVKCMRGDGAGRLEKLAKG